MANGHLVNHGLLVISVHQVFLGVVIFWTLCDGVLGVLDIGVGISQIVFKRGPQSWSSAGDFITQLHIVVIQGSDLRGIDGWNIHRRVSGPAIRLVCDENDDQRYHRSERNQRRTPARTEEEVHEAAWLCLRAYDALRQ